MAKLIKHGWQLQMALMFAVLFVVSSMAYAQSSPNYQIKVDVISGGSGSLSSTNYVLASVIGQSSGIGLQSSASYADDAGYIYAWLESIPIYCLADFDGDRRTDIAVYRSSNGWWIIVPSSGASPYAVAWGASSDIPVPGDYDGDRKTDIAVYRPSNGWWIIVPSSGASPYAVAWGATGDVPLSSNIALTY